jgi:hypothetical protein
MAANCEYGRRMKYSLEFGDDVRVACNILSCTGIENLDLVVLHVIGLYF